MNLSDLTAHRIIPFVVLNDSARAGVLAAALVAGGLPVAEVLSAPPRPRTRLP